MNLNGNGFGRPTSGGHAQVAQAFKMHASCIMGILSRTYGTARAEDAVQEAFARALKWGCDEKELAERLNIGFMTRCASRLALRAVRTEQRRRNSERNARLRSDPSRGTECSPRERLDRDERARVAVDAIGQLPAARGHVVHMMLVDGRRQRDVVRITGLRETTVHNWRHRTVTDLRRRLGERD